MIGQDLAVLLNKVNKVWVVSKKSDLESVPVCIPEHVPVCILVSVLVMTSLQAAHPVVHAAAKRRRRTPPPSLCPRCHAKIFSAV